MFKTLFQAAALAAAVLASAPVMAQQFPDVRVTYADLDLTNPVDLALLDRRLARAVRAVCPSDNGVRDMSRLRRIEACRDGKRAEVAALRTAALAAAQSRSTLLATAP